MRVQYTSPLNFTYQRPPLQPFSLPTSGPTDGNTTVVVFGTDGALAGGTQVSMHPSNTDKQTSITPGPGPSSHPLSPRPSLIPRAVPVPGGAVPPQRDVL